MAKKILILGNTGKMGCALSDAFSAGFAIVGKHSTDLDMSDVSRLERLIEEVVPDIVMNTVAFSGIEQCEQKPQDAFCVNALLPKALAQLSREKKFTLVHFSTDAVFNDEKQDYYRESDPCRPLNVYGIAKYAGDCFIRAIAPDAYIFRISILFGRTTKNTQFVEKMLARIRAGEHSLKISSDIVVSPTYNKDVACAIRDMIERNQAPGLYHLVNQGKASLYDLMNEIVRNLRLPVEITKASHKDFPSVAVKNTYTPLASERVKPLRPWQEAVGEYCSEIKNK
ncbi:MAG: NAD(P)-dependent oxidoreductase [Candidatus Omnitrophota bacterium]|nr:NAD(P)-dependent oxidoreductase [Candidatus Omnitrophota bacterium]